MPFGLYGFGNQNEEERDPQVDAVEKLLAQLGISGGLEFEPAPTPPPRAGILQSGLGSLGDALKAMAAVRAGGAPPAMGSFAAGQEARQAAYEKQALEAGEANRALRNQARISLLKTTQPKQYKPQLKTFNTTDEATGRPVQVPYLFDPNAQTLAPVGGYEQGFFQYVRPFLAQGVNQETGELEFRLVDPLTGGAPPSARGVSGGGLSTLEPKPTAGEAESVEASAVISQQLADYKRLAESYSRRGRVGGTIRSLGQNIVRELPGGQAVSETMGDPQFEEIAAVRDRIGQQLARLVESGRLSDQDREFAMRNLPTVPSLTTESGRTTAAAKIALVEREISARLARKRRLRPGLVGGAPTGGPFSGRSMTKDQFNQLRADEQQRWLGGGGTVQ